MKRFTTIVCCIAFMIAGISLGYAPQIEAPGNQVAMAQPTMSGFEHLNEQLKANKEHYSTHASPIKDSINIRDSVVIKTKWKTRYRYAANHTEHRDIGTDLPAITPDSMPMKPMTNSMSGREEKPDENVDISKVPSIQLSVDGQVVYSSENDNHSAGEG